MNEEQKPQPNPPADERSGKRPRHEGDEPVGRGDEQNPRSVGKQGHRDMERGLQDTDIRGGNEYQQRSQNDAHANTNSDDANGANGGTSSGREQK